MEDSGTMALQRTNIYLEVEQVRALRLLAAVEGQSVATLVRQAVDAYLRERADEATWRAQFEELLGRVRTRVPRSIKSEEIEADITAAHEEVREIRRAARGR